ncbi:flagellar biosynthetic protein FliO [Acidovorax sp. Root217]|uniref:FliO/MopB family protein n=1 Tax=Acidovorax sp. Root217 TaxID=1736492 RepID=UPI00070910E7|nr:flagellar biosynthetic protein FliO [Acidovorax sp. Root217]KRC18466.1 flagellar biosynthesis protein FliO [Acidovorax sp. Root217]
MTQTLVVVVLFVGAMACLPWLIKRLQQRHAAGGLPAGAASRVLSAVAVGPQQRVVTVEVGPEGARTWLVLGVTAQQVSCLHVLAAPSVPAAPAALPVVVADNSAFAREMAAAEARKEPHV